MQQSKTTHTLFLNKTQSHLKYDFIIVINEKLKLTEINSYHQYSNDKNDTCMTVKIIYQTGESAGQDRKVANEAKLPVVASGTKYCPTCESP